MRKKRNFIFNIVVVLFVFFCALSVIKMQIEINRLKAEEEILLPEIEALKDENARYNDLLNTPIDQDYYEEKAREKLNLRLPEEIIFYNDLIN